MSDEAKRQDKELRKALRSRAGMPRLLRQALQHSEPETPDDLPEHERLRLRLARAAVELALVDLVAALEAVDHDTGEDVAAYWLQRALAERDQADVFEDDWRRRGGP